MGASQAVWSRDSHVVSAFTHLRRYQTQINWHFKKAVPGWARLQKPVESIQNYQPCHHLSLQAGFCNTLHQSVISASVRLRPWQPLRIGFLEKK